MDEPHIDSLVLRVLISVTNCNDDDGTDFARAIAEIMAGDHTAVKVILQLAVRATDSMLELSESTMLTPRMRPRGVARAELMERLEWRLLDVLEKMDADR